MARRKRLLELARTYPGWDVVLTKGGHIRMVHRSSGQVVFASSSPSDRRADKNIAAIIRRTERRVG